MASEKHLSLSPVSGGEYAPPPPQDVSAWKKVLYYLWDSDQYLKSPEERHMLRKLDCGMLLCATLGWVSHSNLVLDGCA